MISKKITTKNIIDIMVISLLIVGSILFCQNQVMAETVSQNDIQEEVSYVEINEAHFPDASFRAYLQTLDEDQDGKLAPEQIDGISVSDPTIESVQGIEYFTEITSVNITQTKCTEIDLSKNVKLQYVTIWANYWLKKLDISKCSQVEELDCCYNGLEQLDVSGCPDLIHFACFENELMYLDVSQNKWLRSLLCSTNHLTSLDISNNLYIYQQANYFENFDNIRYCHDTSLDLNTLKGFDLSKASEWENAVLEGSILKPRDPSQSVSYTYDIGRGWKSVFEIKFTGYQNPDDSQDKESEEDQTLPEGPDTWVGKTGTESFVYRLYNVALGREAEETGFNDWNQKLQSKTNTAAEVARGFISSQEFKNKGYNDTQYVKMLYRTMFGREADEGGLADWLDALENGMSREYVYKGFVESVEFSNLCNSYGVQRGTVSLSAFRDQNRGATGFMARLYTRMLGRKYEDDGLEYWCRMYLTGSKSIEAIASDGFLHSQELQNQNLSNEEFVTRMYQTFLNREPEEAGLKDWINRLETGEVTRDSLVYGFTNSAEFANIKAEYGL